MYEWANEMNCAVTVCDTKGIILYMNEKACRTFAKHGDLIGKNLFDCHNPQSQAKIRELLETGEVNAYTIEKNGVKKMIYQTAWKQDGVVGGLTGYPSHQGEIILFGKEHGEVLSITDAMSVTKIRTGAVSAAASRALARKNAKTLAILGCGAQGHSHLNAIAEVFGLTQVYAWDAYPQAAEALAQAAEEKRIPGKVCDTVQEAVENADIVCTLTPSKIPILKKEWLRPGTHVNAVGACAPADRELDSDLAAESTFFGDNRESVLHESGDFLIPLKEGRYTEAHLAGTLGDVLLGGQKGRTSEDEITVFEALGMAVEDIACAIYLYEQAKGGSDR